MQVAPLVDALSAHRVRWVLCGSHVLALHGARIVANDLDVVPALDDENLARVAACLRDLDAVAAYLDGYPPLDTVEKCLGWRPEPADAETLDWLFVTRFGMFDIVIRNAAPYEELMSDAVWADQGFWMCDPRRGLRALEPRARSKDKARRAEYARMRARFGMPEMPGEE